VILDRRVCRDPLFMKDTLLNPGKAGLRPHAGTLHVHPNGRFLYQANRDSGTESVDGKTVSAGGENNIAVWTLDPATGEPTLIQNAEGPRHRDAHLRDRPERPHAGRCQHKTAAGA
jgi:hypothetical protein